MTTTLSAARHRVPLVPLLRAAHIGPAVAVTAVTALLAMEKHLPLSRGVLVTGAVLAGQLTIGWGNDLGDAVRDRRAGRTDKPLANGELRAATARVSLLVAAVACVLLSFSVGWRSGLVHLGLGVVSGHLYNVLLKGTVWSWLPYVLAFGTLPAVVTLAGVPPHWPAAWMMLSAAALGVAAHFLNVLPDLGADAATGVRGLPHRLGAGRSRAAAVALLVAASVVAAFGARGRSDIWTWSALTVVAALALTASVGRGRTPFYTAIAIALVDVVLLTLGAAG